MESDIGLESTGPNVIGATLDDGIIGIAQPQLGTLIIGLVGYATFPVVQLVIGVTQPFEKVKQSTGSHVEAQSRRPNSRFKIGPAIAGLKVRTDARVLTNVSRLQ
jgi:hypothetical protein